MPPAHPSRWSDELAHEVRTALTSVKLQAHLLSRVIWPTTEAEHHAAQARVAAIDQAATTAVRHLNRLIAEHGLRWSDGEPPPETPGADPAAERDPAAPRDDPLAAAR